MELRNSTAAMTPLIPAKVVSSYFPPPEGWSKLKPSINVSYNIVLMVLRESLTYNNPGINQ